MTAHLPDLAGLERLLAAATPGPWWVWDRGVGYHLAVEDPDGPMDDPYNRPRLVPEGDKTDLGHFADAALIVAAVTHLPALIAAVRERDAVIAAVRELTDDWLEGRTVLDGSKQMELIATTLAVLPGIEQEEGKA